MIKKYVAICVISLLTLSGCGTQQKALDAYYAQLYLDVMPQLDDGYTLAQLKAIETEEERNKYFSTGYEKANVLIQKIITTAETARAESSGSEAETLDELITMYKNYQGEIQQAIKLLRNYKASCPDAANRPAGTLPTHACGDIALTVEDLKSASLVCVYNVSAESLADFPNFDLSKVFLLNSTMDKDVISQGCNAFTNSDSLLGYPHRTSKWVVPEGMQREVTSNFVIAVADGLFTNLVSDIPILEQAVYGKWFGYCSSFKSIEAKLSDQVKTGNCY